MGHEIVYCFKCSSRIVGAETDRGVAYAIGARIACAACASELLPTLAPAEQEELLARMSRTSHAKPREPSKRTPRRGTEAVPAAPVKADPRTPLLIAGGVGAVVVLLLIVMASQRGDPRPPAPEVPERPVEHRPAKVPVEAPRPKETFDAELARIDDSIAGVMRQEGFKEAVDYLTSARRRHDALEWTKAIDQRLGKCNDEIQTLYLSLQTRAVEAKRRGAEAELKELVERIARWNLPDRAASLKKMVDATPVAVFRQPSDGLLCIEAEHFTSLTEAGGHAWQPVKEPAGFEGEGAMGALPNNTTIWMTDYVGKSPRMDFSVEFTRTGAHYLWVRASGATDADNSVHAGLDGTAVGGLSGLTWNPTKAWTWANKKMDQKVASFTVSTAGPHTINFWIREDGAVIDRFVITPDPKWSPKGAGPAETPR